MQDIRAHHSHTGSSTGSYERLERLGKGSWWALGVALIVILAFMLLGRFGSFIVPSVIGIALATTLSPVVTWLSRRGVPRLLGAVLVTLVVVVAIVLLIWAIIAIVVDQGPQLWSTLKAGGSQIDRWLGGSGSEDSTLRRLQSLVSSLRSGAAGGVLPIAVQGARDLYALVVAVFLAGGFSFFFLWQGPDVRRWVSRHLTQPENVGLKITASLVRTTRRYVAGLSGIGAAEAVIVGTTAAVAGVRSWPVIALLIFLGNYIPYIGGAVAGVVGVLLAVGSQGAGPAIAVFVAIVIAYFAGSHLGAFFIGEAIRLPVTAVFVLTMTGATVAGIFGAAAAAPLARLAIDTRTIIRTEREPGAGTSAAGSPAAGPGPATPGGPAP